MWYGEKLDAYQHGAREARYNLFPDPAMEAAARWDHASAAAAYMAGWNATRADQRQAAREQEKWAQRQRTERQRARARREVREREELHDLAADWTRELTGERA